MKKTKTALQLLLLVLFACLPCAGAAADGGEQVLNLSIHNQENTYYQLSDGYGESLPLNKDRVSGEFLLPGETTYFVYASMAEESMDLYIKPKTKGLVLKAEVYKAESAGNAKVRYLRGEAVAEKDALLPLYFDSGTYDVQVTAVEGCGEFEIWLLFHNKPVEIGSASALWDMFDHPYDIRRYRKTVEQEGYYLIETTKPESIALFVWDERSGKLLGSWTGGETEGTGPLVWLEENTDYRIAAAPLGGYGAYSLSFTYQGTSASLPEEEDRLWPAVEAGIAYPASTYVVGEVLPEGDYNLVAMPGAASSSYRIGETVQGIWTENTYTIGGGYCGESLAAGSELTLEGCVAVPAGEPLPASAFANGVVGHAIAPGLYLLADDILMQGRLTRAEDKVMMSYFRYKEDTYDFDLRFVRLTEGEYASLRYCHLLENGRVGSETGLRGDASQAQLTWEQREGRRYRRMHTDLLTTGSSETYDLDGYDAIHFSLLNKDTRLVRLRLSDPEQFVAFLSDCDVDGEPFAMSDGQGVLLAALSEGREYCLSVISRAEGGQFTLTLDESEPVWLDGYTTVLDGREAFGDDLYIGGTDLETGMYLLIPRLTWGYLFVYDNVEDATYMRNGQTYQFRGVLPICVEEGKYYELLGASLVPFDQF